MKLMRGKVQCNQNTNIKQGNDHLEVRHHVLDHPVGDYRPWFLGFKLANAVRIHETIVWQRSFNCNGQLLRVVETECPDPRYGFLYGPP